MPLRRTGARLSFGLEPPSVTHSVLGTNREILTHDGPLVLALSGSGWMDACSRLIGHAASSCMTDEPVRSNGARVSFGRGPVTRDPCAGHA